MIAEASAPRALRARDFASRGAAAPPGSDVVRAPDEELGYRTVGWPRRQEEIALHVPFGGAVVEIGLYRDRRRIAAPAALLDALAVMRSEEHTSELQSLMRISYAVFCLKQKKQN